MCFRWLKSVSPALFAGLLLVLGFPPFNFWFITYLALIPLLWAAREARPTRAASLHALTGTLLAAGVYHGVIAYNVWLFVAIVAVFALSFALWGILVRQAGLYWRGPVGSLLAPALIWTGIEAITTSTVLAVPINLGASQAGQPVLIQSAALFGVFGVSFLIVLVNTAIVHVVTAMSSPDRGWQLWIPVAVAVCAIAANVAYGYARVTTISPAPTIKVATVQPVISSDMYRHGWRLPENRRFMKDTLETLTARAAASGAGMIFWPEGGNGYLNMRIADLRERLYRTARENDVELIVSSEDMDGDGKRFNSVFAISRDGTFAGRYDKVKPVPVAESSLTAGSEGKPLAAQHGKLGVAICFESTLPSLLRRMTAQGAEILFVTGSDAAFKRSALVFAHAQLAVFRAVENGRWLIRAANTGPSLIVSPRGEIVRQSQFYARDILVAEVAALRDKTFFTRWGYLLPGALAIGVMLFAGFGLFSWFLARRNGATSARKRPVDVSREQRRRTFMAVLKTTSVSGMVCAAVGVFIVGASLYFTQRTSASPPGYLPAVRDFIAAGSPQPEQAGENFLQARKNTCGAAALAYVFTYFGRDATEEEVLRQVSLTPRGLSMLALKQASLSFGFDAMGVKENYPALQEEVLPAIAYINDSHYVVINDISAHEVLLFDPMLGHVKVPRAVFERIWNGYLLLIRVRPIPVAA